MGLLFGKIGYYLVLGWCCVSIFVFMVSWGLREGGTQGTQAFWTALGVPGVIQAGDVRWEFRPIAILVN